MKSNKSVNEVKLHFHKISRESWNWTCGLIFYRYFSVALDVTETRLESDFTGTWSFGKCLAKRSALHHVSIMCFRQSVARWYDLNLNLKAIAYISRSMRLLFHRSSVLEPQHFHCSSLLPNRVISNVSSLVPNTYMTKAYAATWACDDEKV